MTTPTPGQPLSEADVAYRPHAPVSRPGDGVEGPDSFSGVGKFFLALDHLTRTTWRWGESCGIDNVSWDEKGDSYNEGCRADHLKAKRAVVEAFHAAVAEKAALTPPAEPVSRPAGGGLDLESGEARTKVVNIVERYVTGWGGEYADNPYEAAPLLAGEILSLFRPHPTAGEGEVVARIKQMIVDCEADPDGPLMLSSSVAAEHAKDLRSLIALLRPAAPDAGQNAEGK